MIFLVFSVSLYPVSLRTVVKMPSPNLSPDGRGMINDLISVFSVPSVVKKPSPNLSPWERDLCLSTTLILTSPTW